MSGLADLDATLRRVEHGRRTPDLGVIIARKKDLYVLWQAESSGHLLHDWQAKC
jgi:hypothetical protein